MLTIFFPILFITSSFVLLTTVIPKPNPTPTFPLIFVDTPNLYENLSVFPLIPTANACSPPYVPYAPVIFNNPSLGCVILDIAIALATPDRAKFDFALIPSSFLSTSALL